MLPQPIKTTGVSTIFMMLIMALSLFSCSTQIDRFTGKTVSQEHILPVVAKGVDTGFWETPDLTLHFSYPPISRSRWQVEGEISVASQITNSFPKIDRLHLFVNFLDASNVVIATRKARMLYPQNGWTPDTLSFDISETIPDQAVAFCFSYAGIFIGEDLPTDSRRIDHNPFS